MANSLVQPYPGPFAIDLRKLNGTLVDVVPGGTRGLRREKTGIAGVLSELQKGIPLYTSTLGISAGLYDRIEAQTASLEEVREAKVQVRKLAEILDETEAAIEDEREGDIGSVVKAARDASRRKDPSIVAAFEQTIRYHGQNAARAHATRRKNAEQSGAEPTEEAQPAPPEAPSPQ